MFRINIDHKQFSADLKRHGQDLRVMSRRVVRRVGEELVGELKQSVGFHDKTGDMIEEIELITQDPWNLNVFLGDSRFLDSGSEKHAMPWDEAEKMAGYYGKTTGQFWGMVKKYGTRAHPFIEEDYNAVLGRRERIYQEEIDRIR